MKPCTKPSSPRTGPSLGLPGTKGPTSRRSPLCGPVPSEPKDRMADLGSILALGYRRARLRQIELAESPLPERSCNSVNSPNTSNERDSNA